MESEYPTPSAFTTFLDLASSAVPSTPPRDHTLTTRKIAPKRIIACCDGTWQNGLALEDKSGYTNILRIARALEHHDTRAGDDESVPQITYYGSGIGSDPGLSSLGEGITGAGLATKVEEAYAFLAGNYVQGDEISLFGFSRGAYTARMVAGIIGEIGLLGKVEMERFPELFIALQAESQSRRDDKARYEKIKAVLEPFRKIARQQTAAAGGFLIKLVGVFDTVGSVGLPPGLHFTAPKAAEIFGFKDTYLGAHIKLALHALALNETRVDFAPTLWTQTKAGADNGQVLKQVWFSGSHSDIGGGWPEHDSSDIALAWMVANSTEHLSFDLEYINSIPHPTAPWGELSPHNSETGIYSLMMSQVRSPPKSTEFPTSESVHSSVKLQKTLTAPISAVLTANPALIQPLEEFEKVFKNSWKYVKGDDTAQRVKPQTLTALALKTESQPVGIVQRVLHSAEGMVEHLSGITVHGH